MPVIKDLHRGELYQIWRKRNRIRLTDIAKYCSCSASAISQFENEIIDLSPELFGKYNEFIRKYESKM